MAAHEDEGPDWGVECRPDPEAGPVPARFGVPGRMREVVRVADRWEGEDHRYFRVETADGATWILRRDLRDGTWRLHFFREAGARPQ